MRRNRMRGKRLADVPTLTAALGVDDQAPMAPTVMLPERANADPIEPSATREGGTGSPGAVADTDSMPLDSLSDVPVLTDAVLEWPPRSHAADAAPAQVRDYEFATGDAFPNSPVAAGIAAAESPPRPTAERPAPGILDPGVDGAAGRNARLPASPVFEDEFILDIPPVDDEPADGAVGDDAPAVPAAAATLSPGSVEWDALAEEIRTQVLQRLDLFTDTGLRDQLGARLRPIVERASTELIATINHQLGELVRGYVAEAIEREIETWRQRNG